MSQDSFNIANVDGATFRANNNIAHQAAASINSGATEPTTKYIYMWWADTTAGLLKQRNAANTGWIVKGVLADRVIKHKTDATTAPTATDDSASGFDVGSTWADTTNNLVYVCTDATATAAVWKELSPAASGGGAGAWALISTGTASNSASLDFTGFDATKYSSYMLIFESVVPSTNGVFMWLRMSSDGGTTFDAGAGNYRYSFKGQSVAGAFDGQLDTGQIVLNGSKAGGTADGFSGTCTIYSASDSLRLTKVTSHLASSYSGFPIGYIDLTTLSGGRIIVTVVNAVRIMMSSGNIASGTIRFLGQVK